MKPSIRKILLASSVVCLSSNVALSQDIVDEILDEVIDEVIPLENVYITGIDPNADIASKTNQLDVIGHLDVIEKEVIGIDTYTAEISTKTDTVIGHVDELEGYVDGLEGYVDELEGYVDGVEAELIEANDWLESIDGELVDVNAELNTQTGWLEDLHDEAVALYEMQSAHYTWVTDVQQPVIEDQLDAMTGEREIPETDEFEITALFLGTVHDSLTDIMTDNDAETYRNAGGLVEAFKTAYPYEKEEMDITTADDHEDSLEWPRFMQRAAYMAAFSNDVFEKSDGAIDRAQIYLDEISTTADIKESLDLLTRVAVEQLVLQAEANAMVAVQMAAKSHEDLDVMVNYVYEEPLDTDTTGLFNDDEGGDEGGEDDGA
ncbi:MAG: type IV secretion system protein [Pseudomonadota bacterium]